MWYWRSLFHRSIVPRSIVPKQVGVVNHTSPTVSEVPGISSSYCLVPLGDDTIGISELTHFCRACIGACSTDTGPDLPSLPPSDEAGGSRSIVKCTKAPDHVGYMNTPISMVLDAGRGVAADRAQRRWDLGQLEQRGREMLAMRNTLTPGKVIDVIDVDVIEWMSECDVSAMIQTLRWGGVGRVGRSRPSLSRTRKIAASTPACTATSSTRTRRSPPSRS